MFSPLTENRTLRYNSTKFLADSLAANDETGAADHPYIEASKFV